MKPAKPAKHHLLNESPNGAKKCAIGRYALNAFSIRQLTTNRPVKSGRATSTLTPLSQSTTPDSQLDQAYGLVAIGIASMSTTFLDTPLAKRLARIHNRRCCDPTTKLSALRSCQHPSITSQKRFALHHGRPSTGGAKCLATCHTMSCCKLPKVFGATNQRVTPASTHQDALCQQKLKTFAIGTI